MEELPRLQLPHRGYLLFEATIDDLDVLDVPHQRWGLSPDLFWPTSREWLVGGDTDLVATFVGGPDALVDRVLERLPGAAAVQPSDQLTVWDEWALSQARRPSPDGGTD
ncbi:hypothetical protein N802_08100 [Knoellia sinensis KCTC 19936]|uniref:Uncharacterized protein n=1 Tax=Knoellia sinensis KCTC 19936 TaxID=1385520 RepID=A0A0A0JD57_9MICO|nr:hypothetical protein [Knoellia sinensis]KGN33957.1 hypothetical protein N802_08100 [Knoellia sinensis KCTC 19936]